MKIKVSDYIADFLVKKGITHVFTVVGGGAMHLNDSLGHHEKITSIYCHHEQAAAMAVWSVATTMRCASLSLARSATRTTMGLPAISAKAFSGSLLEARRAGMMTVNGVLMRVALLR